MLSLFNYIGASVHVFCALLGCFYRELRMLWWAIFKHMKINEISACCNFLRVTGCDEDTLLGALGAARWNS